jgi:hypothetical protein
MMTSLGLVLIGIGVIELLGNKQIARMFDPYVRSSLRSTTRQNVLGISLLFIASGSALLMIG